MKTQTNSTDKARPLNHAELAETIRQMAWNAGDSRKDFYTIAEDVDRLNAEHAALVAVAETARKAEIQLACAYQSGNPMSSSQCTTLYGELANALSNLASVRGN